MKRLATLLFMFLMIISISAQDLDIQFENISTFSGLSASRAKCIFQDSEGYLWIGTMGGGLNRYDGYSFTVYKNKEDDSTSLIQNNIYSLAENQNGEMWIATGDGVSNYIRDDDKFKNYFFRELFNEISELGFYSTYEVFVDSKDRLWVGDSYHGALLYNKDEDVFKPIPQQSKDSIDSLPQIYGDFTEDSNGKIWASGGASGLFWFDESSQVFRPAVMTSKNWNLLKNKELFRISADSENNIWVMTTSDLNKYITSSQELVHLVNYAVPNPINGGYEGELVEDLEGNMYAVHINLPYPIKFQNLSNKPIPLKTINIQPTDIFIDSFGIVWISDWSQGLNKYVPTKQSFYQLEDTKTGKILFGSIQINVICQSLKDTDLLFIVSKDFTKNNITSYNSKSGEIKKYYEGDKNIFSMISNVDGTFWLGIWDVGVVKWNPQNGEFKQYFSDPSKTPNLANTSVPSFLKDDNGNLWIGAFNGLYRMSSDEKNLELIIPEYVIAKIYSDENILWLGTYGSGLIKYNLNTNNVEIYQYDKYSNSISNNIVWDIYRDNEGFLWVATEGGLNQLDLRTNEFKVYKEKDGLGNDYVAAILTSTKGSVWMATQSGISKMYKDLKNGISFSNYDVIDGLSNPNFVHPVKSTDNVGRFYFGGDNGLYYFTPKDRKAKPPIMHFTDMIINGQSAFDSKNNNAASFDERDLKLELNHEQNTLQIEFIALHYGQPSKNKYSYYLEGYDSDWQYSTNRDVQYLNLDPGSYNFHLRSANRDGVWTPDELTLSINIGEPWWNTWFAYLVYFGLVIGGLSGVRQFELKRREENENKKLLQAENKRKSEELEEARKLQLSMLPKFIPQLPDVDIAVYMKTATEVGGDYYDFHVGIDGTLTVVIGDATGHGMRAGTMVTSSKNLFSSYAENHDIINTFHEMTRCIKNMHLDNLSMCMTMIKISNNSFRMSSAGMPPVYIYRKKTSSVEEYLFEGMPLGTMRNFPYEERESNLDSGDTILLMSDGFPELLNNKEEIFGFKRCKHLFEEIAHNAPEDIISKLNDAGSEWVKDKDPDDDVTFVVIKVK
jgi:serine phosphatase RsbU (regulator of sigma subunit)/ligand-binding sensor domain-containing protein